MNHPPIYPDNLVREPNLVELRNTIMRARHAYYTLNAPIMSDGEYDKLEDTLRAQCPNDPILKMVGAPVDANSVLTKAKHKIAMGSQNKLNSVEEFRAWCAKNAVTKILASLKGDGASAAAYYEDGRLVQAISRGDGQIGEDVTVNAMKFQGLPLWCGDAKGPFTGAVRFEILLTISDWGKADPTRATNPRNLGSGIMGRKNGHQCELLSIRAFDIDEMIDGIPVEWSSELDKVKRLEQLGFGIMEYRLCSDTEEAIGYFEDVMDRRSNLDIWIDGVVMKIDDASTHKALGYVDDRPKFQVAWKFPNVGVRSVLRNVVVSGGHNGGLYPTAQFDPISIGGTTVSNASLANYDEIERLGLAIGDTILVTKANEIIPKVIDVVERPLNRVAIEVPCNCPFCGAGVARKLNSDGSQGVLLVCTNDDCEKKSTGKIRKWIDSLDILGIGDAVLESMIEEFDMDDASDLYRVHLEPERLSGLQLNGERGVLLGAKRAASIIAAIEAKRELSLDQFLGSLGIDGLGKRRVALMAKAAGGSLNSLQAWRDGALRDTDLQVKAGVPGIGNQIQDGVDKFNPVIEKMLKLGVRVSDIEDAPAATGEALTTVCISGKLPSGKKKSDYEAPLAAKGYQLVDDVSKGLGILVVADPASTSSKTQKAQKLGIRIIDETALIALIE